MTKIEEAVMFVEGQRRAALESLGDRQRRIEREIEDPFQRAYALATNEAHLNDFVTAAVAAEIIEELREGAESAKDYILDWLLTRPATSWPLERALTEMREEVFKSLACAEIVQRAVGLK